MFSFAKSLNMVAMKDVALLYTSRPDSPCGNLLRGQRQRRPGCKGVGGGGGVKK